MSLDNLVGKTLERVEADAATIARLLGAADRNIRDAKVMQVSNELRFDAAYKAIMQLANAALQANGYRTLTSAPGHHMTMIQSLCQSIGLDSRTMIMLDGLRKQRNVADYSGDIVPASAVIECLARAEALQLAVSQWIAVHRPELLET